MKFGGKSGNLDYIKDNDLDCRTTWGEMQTIMNYNKEIGRIKAEERMNKETDPHKKMVMKRLILKGEYNFDFIFGPES